MPLVVIDEVYDGAHASDGFSRFGAYLRQRAHLFADGWDPMSPATFAATVWGIATSPVMTPPYARVSPDVWDVDCRHSDEPGVLIVEVDVRIPWPVELRDETALRGWGDWIHVRSRTEERVQLLDPVDDRRAALFGAKLRLPIGEEFLPWPCQFGTVDVALAKNAVGVIADHVNSVVGPVVAELRASDSIRVGR